MKLEDGDARWKAVGRAFAAGATIADLAIIHWSATTEEIESMIRRVVRHVKCPGTGRPTTHNCVVCGESAGLHRDDQGRLAADWHPLKAT